MGVSRHSGPVYGAKATLWSFGGVAVSGASTTLQSRVVVPAYETWFITELFVSCSSNSSLAQVTLKVKGTSTSVSYPGPGPDPQFPTGNPGTVAVVTGPTSTAGFNQVTPATVTPGEFEGYGAPANSSVRLVSSESMGVALMMVSGYRRYLDSTRVNG